MSHAQAEAPAAVAGYDFDLPPELIAQAPPAERSGARMLTLDRATGAIADRHFLDLPSLLRTGDLLILNDTRVLPARLYARRAGAPQPGQQPGHQPRQVEVLLTEQLSAWEWSALVRPGRKVHAGERLIFGDELAAEVTAEAGFGERTLRFTPVPDFFGTLERLGHIPLPPYIARDDEQADRERYQTVYARMDEAARGSIAAPTAGLHFTPAVLDEIRARGVEIAWVTLHVGLGTFQPVRVERIADIKLHAERYTLPPATAAALVRARTDGQRIVAAGTTTVRTLEHCADIGNLAPHSGQTSIFLAPGHRFQLVDALLTNFHLPQSTLLMLVCAFAGYESVMRAYRHAVEQRYRFFSYGDCMFLS